ncbi:hypothetical protein [Ornithinibacillus xuwenensis]|uniref:Uncharacterized protein n=1 Tax=Ornithinibacillus xuwenensis TaxID=3144668 RepID=A0ABU9XFI2_9BACI
MEFQGNNKYYTIMLIGGLIVAFLAFFIGSVTQGDDYQFFNAVLFALGGAAAGGFVGVPLVYMCRPIKKVIITDDELQLVESKKPKTTKLSDIQDIKVMRNGIIIRHTEGKLIISKMHGYPLDGIYNQLKQKISA